MAEADESDQMHALNSALMSLTPAQRSELRGMGFLKQEDFLSTRKACSDLEKEYDGRHGLDCRVTKFISSRTNEYIRKTHSCEQRADGTWRRRKFRLPPVEATRAENRAAGIYRPIPVPYNMASSRSIQLTGQAMTSGWGISDSADGKASTMDARVVAAAAVDDLRTRQIYCGPSGCVERPRVQMLGDAFAWAKHNSACRWGFRCCDGDEYSNQPQYFKDVAFIANADDGWEACDNYLGGMLEQVNSEATFVKKTEGRAGYSVEARMTLPTAAGEVECDLLEGGDASQGNGGGGIDKPIAKVGACTWCKLGKDHWQSVPPSIRAKSSTATSGTTRAMPISTPTQCWASPRQ